MNQKDKNIKYLEKYQQDLLKIVSKNRKPMHVLTVEEIISDINAHYLNKISERMDFADETAARKFMYRMAVQFVKWTAKGSNAKDQRYLSKRVDALVSGNEDNPEVETAYDLAIATMGEEDDYFKNLNKTRKYKNIKKWIFDYSNILTDLQKAVLPHVMKGVTLDEIGNAMGVSHQAVSALVRESFDRIKASVKINKTESEILEKGNKGINYLFSEERKEYRRFKHYNRSMETLSKSK